MTACPQECILDSKCGCDRSHTTRKRSVDWTGKREVRRSGTAPVIDHRSFGAVGLRLCCVVSGKGYGLFLVRAGLFKTKSNIGKLKETRAGGDTAETVVPGAFAGRSFQA